MAGEYWDRFWTTRRSRRKFLGGATAVGAGAAGMALVGCGGDSSSSNSKGGASSLATPTPAVGATPTKAADPFANAKRGGTYQTYDTGDAPSIDPYGNGSFHTKVLAAYIYSRLFKYNAGPGVAVRDLKPVPDAAASAEPSPDGLSWVVKLKPDLKFHNVAPVNGRAVTSDDVKYTWNNRVSDPKVGVLSKFLTVDHLEYPDQQTIKFILKQPDAAFLDTLADTNAFFIMPKESDASASGFDPAKVMIGSGPWLFDSYTPSVSYKFKKNPSWYMTGFPLMDAATMTIIPQYASQLAQFEAGSLDVSGITADDLVSVNNQIKGLQLYGEVSQLLSFLFFDSDPASPWNKDPRVKQAISMSLDRDGLTDLGYQIKKLQAAGLKVRGDWNNIIPAGLLRFWLDPKSPDMGEGGKNFKYDPAAAKALLSAAGFADGSINTTYQYTANAYGAVFNSIAEAQIQMINQIGIKTTTDVQDYNSKYKTQTYAGNFKGIAFGYETPFPEAGGYAAAYQPGNPVNHSNINDPQLIDLWKKQGAELDLTKRKALFNQIQSYHATKMHYVPSQAGAGTGWGGWREWVQTNDIHTVPGSYGWPTELVPFYWKNQ